MIVFPFLDSAKGFAQQERKKQLSKQRLSKSVQEKIDNELLTGMIENLCSLNEFRLAETILKEHLINKKNDAHVLLLLSSVYSGWKKFPLSRAMLDEAIKYKNENTDAAFLEYQSALLLALENKSSESLELLTKLSGHPSIKLAAKANKAIAELKANPRNPLPPWLERRHISRRELSEISMQRLNKAQKEEASAVKETSQKEPPESATVSMNTNQAQLAGIATVSALSPWWPMRFSSSASVNLGSTYDSNILQIPDKLAPLVSDKSGIVHAGSFQVGANSGFGPGNVTITAAASTSINANKDASNLNSINASNNLQWTADETASGFGWGLTNALSGSFMNTDGYKLYNWSNSTGLILAKRVNNSFGVDISGHAGLQRFPGVKVVSNNDDRNGPTVGAACNLNASLGDASLSSGVAWSKQNSKGKNFRTTGTTLSLNATKPFQLLTSQVSFNASATRSAFPEAERSRTDSLFSSTLSWGFPVPMLSERTKLSFSAGNQMSKSSLPDAAFTKYTISAAVDHAF
jgi:hypothetical protein